MIVALMVRKTVLVGVPLCPHHAQRRKIWITLDWVLPVIGIADAFILPRSDVDPGWIIFLVVTFILAGLVIWVCASNPIRPQID